MFGLLLPGCCPPNPTCQGATSSCPGYFWNPPDPIVKCPCDYELENDEDLHADLEQLQRHDTAVADLISIALQNNPSTQQTWANARAAAFSVEIAKSALYPSVFLTETLQYSNSQLDEGPPDIIPAATGATGATGAASILPFSNSALNRAQVVDTTVIDTGNTSIATTTFTPSVGEFTTLTSDLSISYLLLDFGGRQATIEAAKQALYNSNWTHNRQVQQVIINVLNTYYTYMGLSALVVARESDLKNAQTNYDAANRLFEAGVRTKLDVLQAKTDLINIQLNIVDLEGQKKVAYGRLANAIGLPSQSEFQVPDIPQDLPIDIVTAGVEQLIDQAKRHRPDLAAAYALHEMRKEEIVIARSSGLPTLGTFVDLQENNDFNNPSLNRHSLSASLVVSAPLFDGFLYVNRERRAQEILRGACANLRAVELNITLDVLTSYFNFKTAVQSLKYSDEFLKYSEEAYEAALIMYREGIGTILDLLNAQRALANARAQKIQARTQWAIALSNISFAAGTLGTPEEIKPWKQKGTRSKPKRVASNKSDKPAVQVK
ncbi:Conserved hypothetical protein [Candidatus Protochlamydia naegleriophila]|uniref:Outer membrane efflux protein n=1 Tax=Candidatus Protochlamydia naegleriophila TaxID=389348 RepID=A0A0U5JCM9_9BACT|nr:TolC family protein [Candidatus Protochlamydia naegleriophila]CUI17624.1 Conserved hypothetical protein [Candidatus Protochlamydia naegleriophila]